MLLSSHTKVGWPIPATHSTPAPALVCKPARTSSELKSLVAVPAELPLCSLETFEPYLSSAGQKQFFASVFTTYPNQQVFSKPSLPIPFVATRQLTMLTPWPKPIIPPTGAWMEFTTISPPNQQSLIVTCPVYEAPTMPPSESQQSIGSNPPSCSL